MRTVAVCGMGSAIYSTWKGIIGSKTRRQILQRHLTPNKKFGKERVHREEFSKSVNLMSGAKITWGDLATRNMRPQRSLGFVENIYKIKNADKATFYTPIEARVMLAPASKSPVEREFVVDSGASMHMMSKKDLSSDELDTLRRSRNPTVVLTAKSEVHTNEEAQEHVHDLNLFVTVQILKETLAVLLLGKLCEDHGYSYECVSGEKPRLTKERRQLYAKRTTSYLLLFQGYPLVLRRQHRHRRICLQQVQLKSEVTN